MITITNTRERIVRLHDDLKPVVLEVIDQSVSGVEMRVAVTRVALTDVEWAAIKEA